MNNHDAFLRAIADNFADDTPRLIYADWLDQHGDPRADFLRLQHALAQPPEDQARRRELCEQERDLIQLLDRSWVQRVRRYTTAQPRVDLGVLVPELLPFTRTTTRLHPHRAASPLPVWMSKIGGRFLWPASEPWPTCEVCQTVLTPVLQLRQCDVPDFEFATGANLLQLFWCPDEPAHGYQPLPRLFWRTEAAVTTPRADDPDLSAFPRESDWEGYVPYECAVFPERVLEFPLGDEMITFSEAVEEEDVMERVANFIRGSQELAERCTAEHGENGAESLAFYELGRCPGTKFGGNPGFEQDGRRFEHLATFSTWECDSASFRRWLAVEDQRSLVMPGDTLTWSRIAREAQFNPLQQILGMQLGRTQRAQVFVCRDEDPWRVTAYVND